MTTEVSICSNALLRLGADPINSFDEADNFGSNIERARLCANLWPNVRRQVIRSHPWNCATKRVVLSPDARSEEHTSELQSLMRISYAVLCLNKKKTNITH